MINRLLEHPLYQKHAEKFKFVAVGLFNTGFDFVLYAIMANVLGLNAVVANVISVGTAMCVSFYLNMTFVWHSDKSIKETAPKFFAVTIFTGWGVQGFVIWALTGLLGGWWIFGAEWLLNLFAKFCATVFGMVINFVGYRFIFKSKRR